WYGALSRSKIKVGDLCFNVRRIVSLCRICSVHVGLLLVQFISKFCFLSHRIGLIYDLLHIGVDMVSHIRKAIGQDVCISEAEYGMSVGFAEGYAIDKAGISKPAVMVKGIITGVIDTATAFSAEGHIQRGNAQVLQEGRIVGAGTQR